MASEIRVNQIQSRTGVSTISFTDTGPVISGVTTVQGTLTVDGGVTANDYGNITATTATFSGNVSIGGTLTYDDVTNIDSIGVVTARSGINIGVSGSGDNTFIDNLTNGHLNIINSGRQANNGRIRINKTNSASGDTTYFRDFEVYDGKDKLLFLIDGSEGRIGVGTDSVDSKLVVAGNSATAQIEIKRTNSNATGTVGALNFTAFDGHSVANISAVADGDNEGAHLVFRTTSAAGENSPFGGSTVESVRMTSDGDIVFDQDKGGIYHFTKACPANTSTNIFRLSSEHGAHCCTVYLSVAVSGYSVSMIYNVACQYGSAPTINSAADTGDYSGKDFSMTGSVNNEDHTFAISQGNTAADVAVTVVLGHPGTSMTFTKL